MVCIKYRLAPERRNCTYLGCGAYEGVGERMPMVKPSWDCPVSAFETLCCREVALLRASSTRCCTCRYDALIGL